MTASPLPDAADANAVRNSLYRELFNTDSELFGGANLGNAGAVLADEIPFHGRPASLNVTIPPLAVVAFKL